MTYDDMINDAKWKAKWKRAIGYATRSAFKQGIDPESNQRLFDSAIGHWMDGWYKRNNIELKEGK